MGLLLLCGSAPEGKTGGASIGPDAAPVDLSELLADSQEILGDAAPVKQSITMIGW